MVIDPVAIIQAEHKKFTLDNGFVRHNHVGVE